MALLYSDLTNNPETVTFHLRFQINGTSDPDNIFPANCGVTDISRPSAGLFVLTFAEKYPAMIDCVGSVLEATQAHDLIVKSSVAGWSASAGTLTITVVGADGSTAAEDPADNDWVGLCVTFARRTALATTGSI